MALPGLVINWGAALQGIGNQFESDSANPFLVRRHGKGGGFQSVQRHSGITVSDINQVLHRCIVHGNAQAAQPPFPVFQGTPDDVRNLLGSQGLEGEHPAPRK